MKTINWTTLLLCKKNYIEENQPIFVEGIRYAVVPMTPNFMAVATSTGLLRIVNVDGDFQHEHFTVKKTACIRLVTMDKPVEVELLSQTLITPTPCNEVNTVRTLYTVRETETQNIWIAQHMEGSDFLCGYSLPCDELIGGLIEGLHNANETLESWGK